jgi:hypothetical protein
VCVISHKRLLVMYLPYWLLIRVEVSFNFPKDGNKHIPNSCVVL